MQESNPQTQLPEFKGGLFDSLRRGVNGVVQGTPLPNRHYESSLSLYGGALGFTEGGTLLYETKGVVQQADRIGDRFLRKFDDHYMKDPIGMLRRHPKWFFKGVFSGAKRFRVKADEMAAHAHRLGLDEYYGSHPKGIEFKKPELVTDGIPLQDIFRQEEIKSDYLNGIDRFDALATATKYIRKIHDEHGAIGSIGRESFIFTQKDDTTVDKPVLVIPTVPYNPDKRMPEGEQKATDMLDFMASVGFEEYQRSHDVSSLNKAFDTILASYSDEKVTGILGSLAKRGRLTLPGEVSTMQTTVSQKLNKLLSLHNVQRLGASAETSAHVRQAIIDAAHRNVTA